MKHFGDITKISGYEVPVVDVVTGGNPCQDLSVAGKRAGLAGERSGLFMEQVRIIKEMRQKYVEANGYMGMDGDARRRSIKPRYMVWENVPGALSSNGGEDFRAVLEETARIVEEAAVIPGPPKGKWQQCGCIMGNGWSIAWRIHDLQYWGCPQRRRRICLLADFNGDSAGRILFELRRKTDGPEADETVTDTRDESRPEVQSFSEGVPGDFEQGGTEREAVAGDVKGSTGISEQGALNGWDVQSKHIVSTDGVAEPLYSGECRGGGGESYILDKTVYGISPYASHAMMSDNPACNQGGMMVLEGNGARPSHMGDGYQESDTMYTLNATEKHAVAYRKQGHPMSVEQAQGWEEASVNDTLNAFDNGESRTPTLILENHQNDSRVKISEDGVFQTLSSRMGTGGNNTPMVMAYQGFADYKESDAASTCKDGMYVIQKSWDGGDISPTLTAKNAGGNQRMPDKDNFNAVVTFTTEPTPKVDENGVAFSLRSRDHKDAQSVVYGLDRASFNQGANAKYDFSIQEEVAQTIVSQGPGGVMTTKQ